MPAGTPAGRAPHVHRAALRACCALSSLRDDAHEGGDVAVLSRSHGATMQIRRFIASLRRSGQVVSEHNPCIGYMGYFREFRILTVRAVEYGRCVLWPAVSGVWMASPL